MRKILVLGKYYHPYRGGIEENSRQVAEELAKNNLVEARVHAHTRSNAFEEIGGVQVRRFSTWATWWSQPLSPGMVFGWSLSKFDLVHFHAPNPYVGLLLLIRLILGARPKLIITHHADMTGRRWLRALFAPLYRTLAARANAVIVTSLKTARGSGDLPQNARLVEIPLSIDPDIYRASQAEKAEAQAWRASFCGPAPMVGFLGRHARYKGLQVLMQAAAALPGVCFMVAGDGPHRARTEAMAAALGLGERVRFLGGVDHRTKLKLLAACDVLAFPSTDATETFGFVPLEAMAMGAPVVASDLPTGVTDVAVHEETALLCQPGDATALASAIRRLLDDRVLADRLAAEAHARLLARFASPKVMLRTRALFEHVLAEDRRASYADYALIGPSARPETNCST